MHGTPLKHLYGGGDSSGMNPRLLDPSLRDRTLGRSIQVKPGEEDVGAGETLGGNGPGWEPVANHRGDTLAEGGPKPPPRGWTPTKTGTGWWNEHFGPPGGA
jgi:hypothetical protein